MNRPSSLSDQYLGKAVAELERGSGRWPLQPHPVRLEPPFEHFSRDHVNVWDCLVNEWEAGCQRGWLDGLFPSPILEPHRTVVLREHPCQTWDGLVPVRIEQFADDESNFAKAQQFLMSIPQLRRPVAFEIVGVGRQPVWDFEKAKKLVAAGKRISNAQTGWCDPYIALQFVAHKLDADMLQQRLLAQYPNSAVTVEDSLDSADLDPGFGIQNADGFGAELALGNVYCFPLRTFTRLDPDPLSVAVGAMENIEDEKWALLQILFAPAQAAWVDNIRQAVSDPYRPGNYVFNDLDDRVLKNKFASPLFAVSVRVAASSRQALRHLGGWADQFSAPPQRLVPLEPADDSPQCEEIERSNLGWSLVARCTHRPGMLLNVEELSGLVHLPGPSVASERLRRTPHRTRPAAVTAKERGSVLLGVNSHRGQKRQARIPANLRARHVYVAGASGTGKSTCLLNMIIQDITAGEGVGVLDPHGDLIKAVLKRIPNNRMNDVILFDPADKEWPIALNILEAKGTSERERIVTETVMALERYFPTSWGPRLERILTYTIHTVLDALPKPTLADVERMLVDAAFRNEVIADAKDSRFVHFWNHQFGLLPKNAVDPVLNKLSVFLLNPTVRNIICQRTTAFDFDNILNGGKVFLANLSTGMLSEKIAGTFGSFLVTKIVNAAFRRAALPESKRRPFYLYVDEFQAFMNVSVGFERILAEARKYKLVLAGLANQYVGQLSIPVRQAIFGNVGSFMVFRLGVDDAHVVAKEMGVFTAEEILNLEVGQAIARTGGSATAYNLNTFPEPPAPENDPTSAIVSRTRRQYGRPRAEVEDELNGITNGDASEPVDSDDLHPTDPQDDDDLIT